MPYQLPQRDSDTQRKCVIVTKKAELEKLNLIKMSFMLGWELLKKQIPNYEYQAWDLLIGLILHLPVYPRNDKIVITIFTRAMLLSFPLHRLVFRACTKHYHSC